MEKIIEINSAYNSLDKLRDFLTNASIYKCSKEYDSWDVRTDTNGRLEQCIVLQKSGMHAVKLHFTEENTVKITYIIPNKIMNAYFGKSVKARKNIIEIVAGIVKQILLEGAQQKAFKELEAVVYKAA